MEAHPYLTRSASSNDVGRSEPPLPGYGDPDAAIAFSERAVDTGVAMLEDRIRSALVPFRAHFDGLRDRSVRLSAQQVKAESTTVISVLTSPGVARVFSVAAAEKGWPLTSNDPNGANWSKPPARLCRCRPTARWDTRDSLPPRVDLRALFVGDVAARLPANRMSHTRATTPAPVPVAVSPTKHHLIPAADSLVHAYAYLSIVF